MKTFPLFLFKGDDYLIKYSDAISIARSLLGTPYSKYDCINLQKRIIRTAPGGSSKYQTAGTNALWRSKDLLNKRKGVSDAKPGEFVFKWKSQDTEKYQDGLGDFHHIGLVTDRKTVIHSSSVENWNGYRYVDGVRQKTSGYYPGGIGAIETDLDSKWTYTATHKLIVPMDERKDPEPMMIETMKVCTEKDPLNVRAEPSKQGQLIGKIPKDAVVESLSRTGNWDFIRGKDIDGNNIQGYACSQYLMEWSADPEPDPEPEPMPDEYTHVIVDAKGNKFCVFSPFTIYLKSEYKLND